jgi:hypothetical protein
MFCSRSGNILVVELVFGGYLGGMAFERGVKVDVFGESLDNAGFPWRDGRVVNGSRL